MKELDLAGTLSIPKLDHYIKVIEQHLALTVATNNRYIQVPLGRLLKARSKRLRPAFVIAVAASQGHPINQKVINASVAIELVHIASLIHDDIMDNASLRWGKPTINSREGNTQAILIGDYLFGKAFAISATVGTEAAGLIGQAMTSLCDAQSREIGDEYNLKRSAKSLRLVHQGKTASLFKTACQLGAICSELNAKQISAFADYGQNFGLAFQLIDDLLDLLSSPDLVGKPVGNDIREGVYTLPLVLALKTKSANKVKSLIKRRNLSTNELLEILWTTESIAQTFDLIKIYNQLATEQLGTFRPTPALTGLQQIPSVYFNWSMANLIARPNQAKINELLN